VGVAGCTDPKQCPVGSVFNQETLLGTCTSCGPTTSIQEGYYCDNGVSTICPAGSYCPLGSAAGPIECPEDYYCQQGFSEPVECGRLFRCPVGSEARHPGLGAALIIVFVVLATIGIVYILRFSSKRRLKKSAAAAQRHREVKAAYSDFMQVVTGEPTSSVGPMQGFNEKIKYTSSVSIQFENLGMTIKTNGSVVLDGVTGEFPPGSLVACMGGSGAGKSTFMNALANRAPYGDVVGTVTVNGIVGQNLSQFQRLVGFVPQDDIMHDDLTVYENLLYSARLRLPSSMSIDQQRAIVEDVLDILDLSRIRDVVVGSPEKRGISGGQKKRVNIGMELVAYPRVLFLDEPTSGLDSAASLQVARCLQRMRRLGITVVTVIHQPRYSVFRCFSHCILFAKGGRLVYLGPTGSIQRYFEEIGFTLPHGENVADWFIDIVSGQSARSLEGEVDREFIPERDLPKIWSQRREDFLSQIPTSEAASGESIDGTATNFESLVLATLQQFFHIPVDEPLRQSDIERFFLMNEILISKDVMDELFKQVCESIPSGTALTTRSLAKVIAKNEFEHIGGAEAIERRRSIERFGSERIIDRPQSGFWSQLKSFCQRNAAKFDIQMLFIRCIVAAIGAVIVAVTFRGTEEYSMLPTIAQSSLILFSIISASSFLYVFGDERLVFQRESKTGYSFAAYWLGKNVVNLVDVVFITVFYYSFYYIITAPEFRYIDGITVFLLLAWNTSAISHFFSIVLSPSTALLVAVLVPAIYVSMFGGIRPTYQDMSFFQKFIAYSGCGIYSIENLVLYQLKALPTYVLDIAPVVSVTTMYGYDMDDLTFNSLILLAIGFAWRIFTLIAIYLGAIDLKGCWRRCGKRRRVKVSNMVRSEPQTAVGSV